MKQNTPSKDSLLNIINSLNASEKRYFKLFAAHHIKNKKTNYVRLFEYLSEEGKYNRSELLKQLKTGRLPQLRKELFEIILKSLSAYYYNSSVENVLQSKIQQIEILITKGLLREATKMLAKTKFIAEKNEKFNYLITLIQLELSINAVATETKKSDAELNKLHDSLSKTITLLNNYMEYQFLRIKFRNLMLERGGESLKALEKQVMQNPFMQDEKKALTSFSKITFLNLHSIYNRAKGKHLAAHDYGKRLVKFIEASPDIIKEKPFNYASFLLNATGYEIDLGVYDNVVNSISKLRALNFKSDKERAHIYGSILTIELAAYITLKKVNEALTIIPRQEKELEENKKYLIEETFILVYMGWGVIYFFAKQYKKSMKYLNKIINTPEFATHRIDIQAKARLMKLIIYFELADVEMYRYAYDKTHKFLVTNEMLTDENKLILNFLNDALPIVSSSKKITSAFVEFKKKIQQEKTKADLQGYFNIELWVESRTNN